MMSLSLLVRGLGFGESGCSLLVRDDALTFLNGMSLDVFSLPIDWNTSDVGFGISLLDMFSDDSALQLLFTLTIEVKSI